MNLNFKVDSWSFLIYTIYVMDAMGIIFHLQFASLPCLFAATATRGLPNTDISAR